MAYHLVNRFYNLQHLIIADLAVTINIVQLERPIKFILHLPSRGDTEGTYEFLEVDGAGFVRVKDVEHVIGEGGRIAEGEELLVDFLELFFGEHAVGAVLEEAYTSQDVSVRF